MAAPSTTPPLEPLESENAEIEGEPEPPSFPPYPPYVVDAAPPSLADTIMAGRDIRVYQKAGLPKKPARPLPRPAKPRGPKATDVKLSKRAMRAHARCLRRHNAVLTDRLEQMSKPDKRRIICLWREHGHVLPAETIARLRTIMDADEPFKPDQAYEYFINLRKSKKKTTELCIKEVKKDLLTMCAEKRFMWARNATVAFARGIQQRFSRPGRYALADGMLRLSNIIMNEICGYVHMKPPSRRSTHPKAKFMFEMSDKVAVWIDEIISESDDRMLMMDYDEDEDVMNADEHGDAEGFADDFLDMMGGADDENAMQRDLANAFKILTNEMYNRGNTELVNHGKFKQSYKQAADDVIHAEDLHVTATNKPLGNQLNKDLSKTVKPVTPPKLGPAMQTMVDIVANYLAQQAELKKDKEDALGLLVSQMRAQGDVQLYEKGEAKRTYGQAAQELEADKNGLKTTGDDPALTHEINEKLANAVGNVTSSDMEDEMKGNQAVGGFKHYNPQDATDALRESKSQLLSRKAPGSEAKFMHGAQQGFGKDGNELKGKSGASGLGDMVAQATKQGFGKVGNEVEGVIMPSGPAAIDAPTTKQGFGSDVKGESMLPGSTHTAAPGTKQEFGKDGNEKEESSPSEPGCISALCPKKWFDKDETEQGESRPSGSAGMAEVENGSKLSEPAGMATPVTKEWSGKDENEAKGSRSSRPDGIDAADTKRWFDKDGNEVKRESRPPGPTGMTSTETEQGIYKDKSDGLRKINSQDPDDNLYGNEDGSRKRGRNEDVDTSGDDETDPDLANALKILQRELCAKNNAILYKQPLAELTYIKASKWLKQQPRMKVNNTVKESADTARLHKKLERKLDDLVAKKTPANLQDAMQDIIIESSRILAEYFVSNNYKALVRDGLISEMQKKGNEILVEVNDESESFFFAAQRLKKAKTLDVDMPCERTAHYLSKKLDEILRCRPMARKVISTMKEHIKEASEYLSEHVNKPDKHIEAYVALLRNMEAAGDELLIEGNIPKSYKSSAAYLRGLTSFEDQINKPNPCLKKATEAKLKSIMPTCSCHSASSIDHVISESAGLLVSYIMIQGEKTEALKILIRKMMEVGPDVLLRHGTVRKTYDDGVDLLREKNADQLSVSGADPVVARKIQLKLTGLVQEGVPEKYQALMDDVIEDATMYLAYHLLQPRVIKVCKCTKNVFVQCELRCAEILRHVTCPCYKCSRHVSTQALAELSPAASEHLEVATAKCPASRCTGAQCPAPSPAPGCAASYWLYSASTRRHYSQPPQLDGSPPVGPVPSCVPMYSSLFERPERTAAAVDSAPARDDEVTVLLRANSGSELSGSSKSEEQRWDMPASLFANVPCSHDPTWPTVPTSSSFPHSPTIPESTSFSPSPLYNVKPSFPHSPAFPETSSFYPSPTFPARSSFSRKPSFPRSPSSPHSPSSPCSPSFSRNSPCHPSSSTSPSPPFFRSSAYPCNTSQTTGTSTRRHGQMKSDLGARAPIVSTDQMSDWHAMMVSLMWNLRAWRDWIQENIDRALCYPPKPDLKRAQVSENWENYQRRLATEALQWQQYHLFSRQLTMRLTSRYRDKLIVSPTRATNRTETYLEYQQEMLEIVDMFNRWTQWLSAVVKESNTLAEPETNGSSHELHWGNFKMKVEEYSENWNKYNSHLKVCLEQKYRTLIAEWAPTWKQSGPVWVMSACGAVPSGAVPAGVADSELVFVARTTHKCNVLPAALVPSKHCCVVYADGAIHNYTKYQVLCNTATAWQPWRARRVGTRAVRVAPGVYVGRVLYRGSHLLGAVCSPHYRCHVVIFGRPFAFNCYELLVLTGE